MKVLLINKFLYPRGGDAISTLATGELLRNKGHDVLFWGMHHPLNPWYPNENLFVSYVDFEEPMSLSRQVQTAMRILYSREAKRKAEQVIASERPDIVHLNSIAHQISPSILDTFAKHRIPTVMTIHDYKLVCPSYLMLSSGKPCEMCSRGRYHWCFLKRCTKDSLAKSALNTLEMYVHHRILRIYDKVDSFISPSKFLIRKIREMGFKVNINHLPNFVDHKVHTPQYGVSEGSVVYIGRLSEER